MCNCSNHPKTKLGFFLIEKELNSITEVNLKFQKLFRNKQNKWLLKYEGIQGDENFPLQSKH